MLEDSIVENVLRIDAKLCDEEKLQIFRRNLKLELL